MSISAFAAEPAQKPQSAKEHLQNHFKLYGFIRNYFIYDSRESVSGTGDLFYYLPKDVSLANAGTENEMDKNATSSFRFLALTSRLGVDVSGYHIGNVHFGAKFEGDFYSGLSSVDDEKNPGVKTWFPAKSKIMGTAAARLRQAYATITWKDLPLCKEQKASVAHVPRLMNVPGFDGVLIHIGNTASHSAGCILVGENKAVGQVLNSTATFKKLYQKLKQAWDQGEEIWIKIAK